MTISLINPQDLDVEEWTDQMTLTLTQYGAIPRLNDPREWRAWGAALLGLSSIHGILLPNPYQFSDWRRWAERVIEEFASIQT